MSCLQGVGLNQMLTPGKGGAPSTAAIGVTNSRAMAHRTTKQVGKHSMSCAVLQVLMSVQAPRPLNARICYGWAGPNRWFLDCAMTSGGWRTTVQWAISQAYPARLYDRDCLQYAVPKPHHAVLNASQEWCQPICRPFRSNQSPDDLPQASTSVYWAPGCDATHDWENPAGGFATSGPEQRHQLLANLRLAKPDQSNQWRDPLPGVLQPRLSRRRPRAPS